MKLWKSCRILAGHLPDPVLDQRAGRIGRYFKRRQGACRKAHLAYRAGLYHVRAALCADNATAETPAPAVVTVHGWYNANGFQDLFNIELARRGYVVLSPDMIGHGDSEILDWDTLYDDASGIQPAP